LIITHIFAIVILICGDEEVGILEPKVKTREATRVEPRFNSLNPSLTKRKWRFFCGFILSSWKERSD